MTISKNKIYGLGLESSCDETAAAIICNGETILSNKIYTQIELHKDYSGVVPEIASRAHLEKINILIDQALEEAGIGFDDLHYVSATNRPGLMGSLMIALQTAKTISFVKNIPLIAINHLEAHLYAPFLEGNSPEYPLIGLLVSGGNTSLYKIEAVGKMELLGRTVDDAVGEAYDKVSKFLGLGYPGGPIVEKLATTAKERKKLFPKIMTKPGDMRFSYSGLKTAVINYLKENPDAEKSEVVYSFQESAIELLMRRTFQASRSLNIKNIVVAGGVAANGRLRELLMANKLKDENILIPSILLCTDNAAMIGGLAYHYYINGQFDDLNIEVSARI